MTKIVTENVNIIIVRYVIEKIVLTLVAQTKQVVTTFDITFINVLVSLMTLSTFENVADFPTVGIFTVNCNCCTYVGTWSNCSKSSFLFAPMGTCNLNIVLHQKILLTYVHRIFSKINSWIIKYR